MPHTLAHRQEEAFKIEVDFDLDKALDKEAEERAAALLSESGSTTTSTSTSFSSSASVGSSVSITEQISRRFFDVPTPEKFLDDFEIAYGGFLENMRDLGLGSGDIGLALDPASGLMDRLLGEYMGGLSQRAEAGEDIFEIVGTEEDFELLRTEPGTESITKEERESVSTSVGSGGSGSRTERQTQEGEPVVSTAAGKSSSTGRSISKDTSLSTFKGVTEALSRPEISAVFKNSPGDFLADRFHGDAGELATFIQSEKGVRQRQRQTLGGGVVVAGRQS